MMSASRDFYVVSLLALDVRWHSQSDAAEATIKLGNTAPYSGPASAYGTIARAEAAYFQMLNDQGGINGRRIEFLTLDDAYSPAKTVEQTRKLVEQDEVLAMFSSVGTAPNIAVQKYLNAKHVPQIFVSSGATRWNDPDAFSMDGRFQPDLRTRRQALRAVHPEDQAECEDRGDRSERGRRQGLRARLQGRPRRAHRSTGFRDHLSHRRSDHQLANGHDARIRRGCFLCGSDAEIRGPSDQEGSEHGLEAADHPADGIELVLGGAGAGGT